MDDAPSSRCLALANDLDQLLSQLHENNTLSIWRDVEATAHTLANILRNRDSAEDNHIALGRTSLPQTLTSLLTSALSGRPVPDDDHAAAIFEIFRVAANFCRDHDDNRGHLLEAGLPQAIVSILEGYSGSIVPKTYHEPLPLSIPHLKVVQTAIGVLLNASINYDPVKFRLNSLEAAVIVLKLAIAVYPPATWARHAAQQVAAVVPNYQEDVKESWTLRCGLSNWVWRLISELEDVKDEKESRQIFGPDILPFLLPSLLAFVPPFPVLPPHSPIGSDTHLCTLLLQADFDSLEESCMLVESLALDVEDVRLSLARGFNFPDEHHGVPCLSAMLDFVEKGEYTPLWQTDPGTDDTDKKKRERGFDICKAAIIKVVVEVAGEEKNEEVLWDDLEGGEFVKRMITWIKDFVGVEGKEKGFIEGPGSDPNARIRDDLVICAALTLGNLCRREPHATTLLSPPHSLAPILASPQLLSTADIKLKHGVLGLLRNLAQSATLSTMVNTSLTNAGIVQRVAASGVWDASAETMVEVIQQSAIGIVKHLCNANVENTFVLVIPTEGQDAASTGLSRILDLVGRTDSTAIKSEGTRVLVNAIKSLFLGNLLSRKPTNEINLQDVNVSADTEKKKKEAMRQILKPQYASALASLVARSGKYPVLINDGVVALSLMSTHKDGALLVVKAILEPLSTESISATISSPVSPSTSSETSLPSVSPPTKRTRLPMPRRAIDMLASVLRNVDTGSNVPPQIRANVCSLLLHMGKHLNNTNSAYTQVKDRLRSVLEDVASTDKEFEGTKVLASAAQKVVDTWA